jgi:hypothetical protein
MARNLNSAVIAGLLMKQDDLFFEFLITHLNTIIQTVLLFFEIHEKKIFMGSLNFYFCRTI